MNDVLKKLYVILTKNERQELYGLTVAITFLALFDMIGVASIFPFLKVVSDQQVIHTNAKLQWFYNNLGFSSDIHFIVVLGFSTFAILVFSNIFRSVVLVIQTRVIWMKHYTISKRLLTQYLLEPYVFFLNRNSSELTNHLMAEVGRVMGYVLFPVLNIIARFIFVCTVFGFLVFVNPKATILCSIAFVGGYGIIYLLFRKKLLQAGEDVKAHNNMMYSVLNEAFGGIKEIKVLGKEDVFIKKYARPARKIIDGYCEHFIVTYLPRYIFECLVFGGILLVTIYSVVINGNYKEAIPLIGLYALAAYRLMPAIQQMFQDLGSIRFGKSALDGVYDDSVNYTDYTKSRKMDNDSVLSLNKCIEFRDMFYRYPNTENNVIADLNLSIKANTTVGFVGGTGSGKTTIVDTLLGLLSPVKGGVFVDDRKIDERNLYQWRKNVGYVPQHIYLVDSTIASNIAFGVPNDQIDQEAVEKAAKLAHIHDFIVNKLPDGYQTKTGERGVRLSGGERQRIGIARALYHNPSVLVFDEATSSLDGITESAIIEAIYELAHKKTIIIIAHRLTSVQQCDVIYLIDNGRIADQGTYSQLLANNKQFQKMAKDVVKKDGKL